MTASLWLVAGLACAQGFAEMKPIVEDAPAPRPATSKIVSVTVYQGQALVTREVAVPEGGGTIELVVTPMPARTVDGSLYAEGADGLRVLSTRFRARAVRDDTRQEVRARDDLIRKFLLDAQKLQKAIEVQEQDQLYLRKLEGFTGVALTGLAEKGRLDSDAILSLSKYVMETRGEKAKAEIELKQQLQANTEGVEFAMKQVAELSAGSSRTERDAVLVVQKTKPGAGTLRLGYLVGAANWKPQYRLRGAADDAPVALEYLAAVTQQTGEDWPDARVTLSTARPSLDAAPPELLPLKMDVDVSADSGPVEGRDNRSQLVAAELGRIVDLPFKNETPLEDVIKFVRASTKGPTFPDGIPIYVDPAGLQEAEKTMASPVTFDVPQVPLRTSLKLMLGQIDLAYRIKDGLLTISRRRFEEEDEPGDGGGFAGMGGGMGGMGMAGMGGMGMSIEQMQAAGGAVINQAAATDQARELRVADGSGVEFAAPERDAPSVTFAVAGRLDVPSRPEPQLLEVARVELPAEYHAKAVPVLTPRVYRLAKLTNKSDLVLLPGEATVYVGTDFVGRMRLPLVAAGEPFQAGFGVDPQVQVSRRLIRKNRTVQGGNQVFTYEFRIALRNYRPNPVKVQLWDRLPSPQGEAVAVNLVKTSAELSADAIYLRSGRMDNLLRWDLEVPRGTVGEKALDVNYEFRLEYARDLAQPRFLSGGLHEGPIGGGGMGGGMGGMGGGGFRSLKPRRDR